MCLMDPIPDVRASSAKALGNLVAGIGSGSPDAETAEGQEDEFGELLPWMIQTLCSEASPVERSGAAQGLVSASLRTHSVSYYLF